MGNERGKYSVDSLKNILLCLLLNVGLVSYVQGGDLMEKFKWRPTESADKNYPMRIIKGDLYFKDGGSIYIPNRKTIRNGWGRTLSTHVVGEDYKPVPNRLTISWLSFTEKKVYSGEFELPYEVMLKLFRTGFIDPFTKERADFSNIIVGMAIEGEVAIWLSGGGRIAEVWYGEAKEIEFDWAKYINNPDYPLDRYVDVVQEELFDEERRALLKTKGVPQGLWKTYRKKYNWVPKLIGVSETINIVLKTFNGELEYVGLESDPNAKLPRAIPKEIIAAWSAESGKDYRTEIYFDEDEVFKAFNKLHDANPNAELELQLQMASVSSEPIRAFLNDGKHLLELVEIRVERYRR